MDTKITWLKDLVQAEEQMEISGVVDLSVGYDNERTLNYETLQLLNKLKNEFVEIANGFNELKASPLGRIKIYGIAKTQADFMLFRNGYKMIFYFKSPGIIGIRSHFLGSHYGAPTIPNGPNPIPQNSNTSIPFDESVIEARKGPFHELVWTHQEQPINLDALIRFQFTQFVKESSK